MTNRWLGLVAAALLVCVSSAQALTIDQTSRELVQDLDELTASDAQHALAVVKKYGQALPSNRLLFEEIVRRHQELPEAAFGVILFAAIHRDASFWPVLTAAHALAPELQDAGIFYAYKLKRDAPAQHSVLEAKYQALAEHPFDSHLIQFLPFTDDPFWTLGHMEHIAKKADGAASEMLAWAFEVFCAVNKGDQLVHKAAAASPLAKRFGWRCN